MKISACLIVKDEANNIGKCLNSLKDISNEIIVVDTGSTDNTVEIAQSYRAKVYTYQWDNNFSNAKNYALSKATGDWIIFLDADEYFEEKTPKRLKDILKYMLNNKDYDAILCKMINIEGSESKVISVNPIIRVFKGKSGIRYSGAIHEQPFRNGKVLRAANIYDVPLIIYHTGYSNTLLPQKYSRNLVLLNERIKNNDIDNLTYYYMSASHNQLGNSEEAVNYALLALKEPTFDTTIVAYQPYVFLIRNMLKLKDKYSSFEIEKYVDEALLRFPSHPEIWYVRALLKKEQNDYPAAIDSYRKAIECNKNFNLLLNNNFPVKLEKVYLDLGKLCSTLGDSGNALEYYFETLKINKYNFSALKGLYKIIKDQQPAEIILFLNNIYDKSNKDDLVFLNSFFAKLGISVLANYYYKLHEKMDPKVILKDPIDE